MTTPIDVDPIEVLEEVAERSRAWAQRLRNEAARAPTEAAAAWRRRWADDLEGQAAGWAEDAAAARSQRERDVANLWQQALDRLTSDT